jgi:pimeloyl-ACP methyl ester carboxylesterase
MSVKTENQITLGNGLTIGYAEYGDLMGKSVIYLHGCPSSRLELDNPDLVAIAERLHIRLIAPDRPGIGLSEWQDYTIANYPDILAQFADQLGLERFPLLGVSSGGKFVAACAWKIPQRLTTATIVSGTAPFDLPGVKETLSKQDRMLYGTAVKVPWLFRLELEKIAHDVKKNPASILNLFADLCESDKAVLAQPNVNGMMQQTVPEAFRQGTRGADHDLTIEARPWGFALHDIKIPVNIWHGEADIVPVKQARIVAEQIPNARTRFFPNEGHLLIVSHFEEVLHAVVGEYSLEPC